MTYQQALAQPALWVTLAIFYLAFGALVHLTALAMTSKRLSVFDLGWSLLLLTFCWPMATIILWANKLEEGDIL